jgi:hypothetical protein
MRTFSKTLLWLIVFLLFGLYLSTSTIGKTIDFLPEIQTLVDSVSIDKIYKHIEALCWADCYQSRVTFTPGNYKAVEYIDNFFRSLPGITEVIRDTFYVSSAIPPYDQYPLINVIATLKGKSLIPEVIILGGHYDTSGSREENWSSNWHIFKAQGADDNASGVAALMEIARILSDPENNLQNKHTIKFIAFAAEEYHPKIPGIHHAGSLYDANLMSKQQGNLSAVVVLDMIAYNRIADYIEVIANSQSLWLANVLFDIADLYTSDLITNNYPVDVPYSDHESYQYYGFPAVLLMENDCPWYSDPPYYSYNPYYHTQSDTIGTLRETLIEKVTKLALASVASLSVRDQITVISDNHESESLGSFLSVYPNPFNESTKLSFYLNFGTTVKITIFNLKGEQVTTLSDRYFHPGLHEISWQGKNIASGIYFCMIQSQYFNYRIKVTHIK